MHNPPPAAGTEGGGLSNWRAAGCISVTANVSFGVGVSSSDTENRRLKVGVISRRLRASRLDF